MAVTCVSPRISSHIWSCTGRGGFGRPFSWPTPWRNWWRNSRLFFLLPGTIAPVLLLASAVVPAQPAPEVASGWTAKQVVRAERHMVVAAHPLAAAAGLAILERGGSAVDAAIATQLVLNLVEPQSSGIGGGAFLLHYAAKERRLRAYDGRETAPAEAGPNLMLGSDGKPLGFVAALIGGRSVGTPGLVAMLELAHRKHGRLAWAELFQPAIKLALEGYAISPRLARLLESERWLANDREARALYYDANGKPLVAGTMIRNTALAGVLAEIGAEGSGTFYRGASAAAIVDAVRGHATNPGRLSLPDLAAYRPIERDAVCAPYKHWRVCSMGPPSSGGIAVLQILGLLAERPIAQLEPTSLMEAHLFAEASRLAYADRDRYVADPGFVAVPVGVLTAPDYLRERALLIDPRRAMGTAKAGDLGAFTQRVTAASPETMSTTHLSVVDGAGNMVALSSSIESQFGARVMARGFLLNNQLTDFSFAPERDGERVANRVEAGKRPRSSMAPLIVFDQTGAPVLALGSPGGPWIIDYVARALIGVLEQGLTLQQAFERGHVANRNGRTELERDSAAERLHGGLEALGHEVRVLPMTSGLHGIQRIGRSWVSGVDPRRDGAAAGR